MNRSMNWSKQDSKLEQEGASDIHSQRSVDEDTYIENELYEGARRGASANDEMDSDDLTDELSTGELSIEALQAALEQMSIPPCPDALKAVLEETSLEKLVYWKLQALFEHFEEAPPTNVLRTVHEHVERPLFSLVLKKTKGNQSRAAHVLGCNRNTLHRKLKSLAIQPREVRRVLKLQRKRSFRAEIESLVEGN